MGPQAVAASAPAPAASPAPPARLRTAGRAEPARSQDTAQSQTWELVYAAQAGDTTAFGQLYDNYVDMVFRYVLFRMGDRDLAEDVTSETFLRALRRISSVSYQGRDVGAWFITIARNLVFDHVKSSRFRLEVITDEVAEPGAAPTSPAQAQPTAGPEQQAVSHVINNTLMDCVAQLGEDQRECVVLRFLQGLSVAETAHIMRRKEGAIKALQHRAVRRLAQLMPTGVR